MKKIQNFLCVCLTALCVLSSCMIFSGCKKYSCQKITNIAYGENDSQTLNLNLPKGKTGTVGLILMIHGGAWIAGDKETYDDELEYWCEKYGYATASINYRYASDDTHCDDILQDISSSLQKIKDLASEKSINIEKVLLTGISAGAHLSLLYAYKCQEAPIKPVAVVNYVAPTDLSDLNFFDGGSIMDCFDIFSKLCDVTVTTENYKTKEIQDKLLQCSPINFVNGNSVPTVICHGKKDNIVPYSNATTLKNRLDFFGVKNDFVIFENSGHGLKDDKKQTKKAKKLMKQYAETYLK